jgi:hypothetical protein
MTTTQARPAPSDRKPKQPTKAAKQKASARRAEAADEPIAFDFDGEQWTFRPSDATGLEFLAALEDEELIVACRMLLGREQAARLFKGRDVKALYGFFDVMGEAADSANPSPSSP